MKQEKAALVKENQELESKISAAPSLLDYSSTQDELKNLQQRHHKALDELASLKLLVQEKEEVFMLASKVCIYAAGCWFLFSF